MDDFEKLEGRDPASLTDQERYELGLSFYNPLARDDQQIADALGVTRGDAMRIAINRVRDGHGLLDWGESSDPPATDPPATVEPE